MVARVSARLSARDAQERGASRGLVIFPGALGDLICVAPALAAIGRRRDGAALELMAREELARFAVARIAKVARAHSIDRREVSALFGAAAALEARRFFDQFESIDSFFAADDPLFRRRLAAAAPSASVRFHPFRPEDAGHVAEGYLRAVGATADSLDPALIVLESDLRDARGALEAAGGPVGDFVLIFPGSGSVAKNWPAPSFAELAARIGHEHKVIVVLGPAEEQLASIFEERGVTCLRGLELGAVAGLARMARCLVGNDSGVSHLGAAAGARGLVLFGPTDPARWRPLGAVTVLRREPLETLAVDEVAPELRRIASSRRPNPPGVKLV